MSYSPNNPNGQATMANSAPVAIASNQSSIPVTVADGADGATGSKADAVASTDNGTFSQIALIKRMLTNMIKALDVDNAPLTNTKPGIIGGKAIDVTAPTAFTVGDAVTDVHDSATGAKVVLQADTIAKFDSITISEKITVAESTLTRPNNTTVYSAGDMIGPDGSTSMITYSGVATLASDGKDSSGYITGLYAFTSDSGLIDKTIKLVIFNGGFTQTVTDNAGFFEQLSRIPYIVEIIDIPFSLCIGSASNSRYSNSNLRIPYKTTGGSALYGVLVTPDGFTPSAGNTQIYTKITVTKND